MRHALTRRNAIAGLGGVLITLSSGCLGGPPDSKLRSLRVELRNQRSIPVQTTLTFNEVPAMVVTDDEPNRELRWTVTAPAEAEVNESNYVQPGTYEPKIEIIRLQDEGVLHSEVHEVEVPEPSGSWTHIRILVTPDEVSIEIQPNTAV